MKLWFQIKKIQIDTDKEGDKEILQSFLSRKKKGITLFSRLKEIKDKKKKKTIIDIKP